MLTSLYIKNFAIIDTLELDFTDNMTVLTGETGAGKSIIVDTLALVLGGRADSDVVKNNAAQCEIVASFNLQKIPEAKKWLAEQDLAADANQECIVRRVINSDGRSKSYLNGSLVPQQLTRELASFLVDIHGQHEHYSLLKTTKQRELLDDFAEHEKLCQKIAKAYNDWQTLQKQLASLAHLTENGEAKLPLLKYQLEELDKLVLVEDELEVLHAEHRELNAAETIMTACNNMLNMLQGEDETATLTTIYNAQKQLEKITVLHHKIADAHKLLNDAIIPLEAATQEIKTYLNNAELNPERLAWLEQRLNIIYDLARKHQVKPEDLFATWQKLQDEVTTLESSAEQIIKIEKQLAIACEEYLAQAQKLSQSRSKAAPKLAQLITQKMQQLGMPSGKFIIKVEYDSDAPFSSNGLDNVEFLVTANPGETPALLNKVASGGELSRISLALQVTIAAKAAQPTLIFDEVDVGIGGKTAEIVGKMLRDIGANTQILCVTHLPQVAAQGEQHFMVSKDLQQDQVKIAVTQLDNKQRIQEIARMLGGINITAKTLAHAEEMVGNN